MAQPEDDLALVAATRRGDVESFGILVRRYQDRLYSTLLRLSGCAEDARDLLQDAFLRAYEKLGHFHGESNFYTWIYRIAVNLALSDRRRRRSPVRARGISPETLDPPSDPRETEPSRPLEEAERDVLIHQALRALHPDHRAVVVMKDLDGLRYEEIAEILCVPVGTVRSRLHRARAELRERLRSLVDEVAVAVRRA